MKKKTERKIRKMLARLDRLHYPAVKMRDYRADALPVMKLVATALETAHRRLSGEWQLSGEPGL
jgi:hypothetical protein